MAPTYLHVTGVTLYLALFLLCRPDRNKYLDVFLNNVEPDKRDQYRIPEPAKLRALEKDIPYDYFSIMHYGKNFFGLEDANVSTNKVLNVGEGESKIV